MNQTEPPKHPPAPSPTRTYLVGGFRVNPDRRRLEKDGQTVALASKSFETLLLLLSRRGELVTREDLMKVVWADTNVSDASLTQSISELRRVLGDDPSEPEFIVTIPRRGYRFIAPITEIPAVESPELRAASPAADAGPGETGPLPLLAYAAPEKRRLGRQVRLWSVLLIAIGLVAGVTTTRFFVERPAAPRLLRLTLDAPAGTTLLSGGELSPDGRHLAFTLEDNRSGTTQLWIRSLDSGDSRPLPGTLGAGRAFWSPDSQSIGFFANATLKKVGLIDDQPRSLAKVLSLRSTVATWSASGLILYSDNGTLYAVPSTGGTSNISRTPDPQAREQTYYWPQFLPDGRHFLYYVTSPDSEVAGTYVGSLDSREGVRLLDASNTAGVFAPPAYLLFARDGVLLAQSFDLATLRLRAEPVVIAKDVDPLANNGTAASASRDGLMVIGGGAMTSRKLVWADRSGREIGTIDPPVPLHSVMLSLDQKWLAGTGEPDEDGVWLVDLDRNASTRLASDGGSPLISPGGDQVAFSKKTQDGTAFYLKTLADRHDGELILRGKPSKVLTDWSRDGRYIVYSSADPATKTDLWLFPTFGERKPTLYLQSAANELQARISPDGRWLAYASDESGSSEVYVQSFPVPGGKVAISVGGGAQPQWRADGLELFYLAADCNLMVVPVTPGARLQVGRPAPLFRTRVVGGLYEFRNYYISTADGQRFLLDARPQGRIVESLTVIANWPALMRR